PGWTLSSATSCRWANCSGGTDSLAQARVQRGSRHLTHGPECTLHRTRVGPGPHRWAGAESCTCGDQSAEPGGCGEFGGAGASGESGESGEAAEAGDDGESADCAGAGAC